MVIIQKFPLKKKKIFDPLHEIFTFGRWKLYLNANLRSCTNYGSAYHFTCMMLSWHDGFLYGRIKRKSYCIKISLPSMRFVFIWQLTVLIITNSQSLVCPNNVYENPFIVSSLSYYQRSINFTVLHSTCKMN
mgnify:CR=1 FL=1